MFEKYQSYIVSEQVVSKLDKIAHELIPYYSQDLEVSDLTKTAALGAKELSQILLKDTEAPALLVHRAAVNLLSDRIVNYEPETIWLELERFGVDVPEENRNKILMVNTLKSIDPIIYNINFLKNIILVFNDELPNLTLIEEVTPEHIAWAVECLNLLYNKREAFFDYEPIIYIAVVLHRNGYLLAPKNLSFVQFELDKLNKNNELKKAIELALKKRLNFTDATNAIVANQLLNLERVNQYVKLKYEDYVSKLNVFLKPEVVGVKIAETLAAKRKLKERNTEFFRREDLPVEIGTGSIGGGEKSGSAVPLDWIKLDYTPPTFTICATGA